MIEEALSPFIDEKTWRVCCSSVAALLQLCCSSVAALLQHEKTWRAMGEQAVALSKVRILPSVCISYWCMIPSVALSY